MRAYRLARRRQPVAPTPVQVAVQSLDIDAVEGNRVRCRVTCAPGFYMRSLAHDLGATLGCGACLEELRRERSGAFGLEHAVSLDMLERDEGVSRARIQPLSSLLPELPSVVVTDRGSRLAAHGNELMPSDFSGQSHTPLSPPPVPPSAGPPSDVPIKVYDRSGTLLAIAERTQGGILHPRIVLV